MWNHKPRSLFDTVWWTAMCLVLDILLAFYWSAKSPSTGWTYFWTIFFTVLGLQAASQLWKMKNGTYYETRRGANRVRVKGSRNRILVHDFGIDDSRPLRTWIYATDKDGNVIENTVEYWDE